MTAITDRKVCHFPHLSSLKLTISAVQTGNKAFVLYPGGSFDFEDRPIPSLQSDRDLIVQIAATGLCGSDVRVIPRQMINIRLPVSHVMMLSC